MATYKVILMSLSASLGLVKEQMIRTFGRDTSFVDKEFVDVILSNPANKKKLIDQLNKNEKSSVEIIFDGDEFSFAS